MRKTLLFLILFLFFISSPIHAQISQAPNIIPSSDCSWLTFYGILCHDTDDGKLYKWGGAELVELEAGASGDIATDTIWDAAGDLVQGTGANTAEKLTKGAEGTLLRAGATSNVFSTATFADTYAKGTFLYNAAANTVASLAHPGSANYLLYTNAADTSAWIASSADMISLLGSADYATARTNLGCLDAESDPYAILKSVIAAEGDVLVGTGASTAGVITKGANNTIFGVNNSGTLGYFSKIGVSGTSGTDFNFYDPDTTTKKAQFDFSAITADTIRNYAWPDKDGTVFVGTLYETIGAGWDGGDSALDTGSYPASRVVYRHVPYACTITQWTMGADQNVGATAAVVDIWVLAYSADTYPTVANTITASAKPTIATGGHKTGQSSTLSGWTTTIAADSWVAFKIDTTSTITNLTISLRVTRTP